VIKDVMVWLDGSAADRARLSAASRIANLFGGRVRALFLNSLPLNVPFEEDEAGAIRTVKGLDDARAAGDRVESQIALSLAELDPPGHLQRMDLIGHDFGKVAADQARLADIFVTSLPAEDDAEIVPSVLFGSGRSLYLVPRDGSSEVGFGRVVIAWDGSREASRAMAEAMPFLHQAGHVAVVVVVSRQLRQEGRLGSEVVDHLATHGIEAALHRVNDYHGSISDALIAAARERGAELLVMGGYGHSRMREYWLGGVTLDFLRHSPLPILMAH
jgi:nucleotide-binding universal stress UspA family protein